MEISLTHASLVAHSQTDSSIRISILIATELLRRS